MAETVIDWLNFNVWAQCNNQTLSLKTGIFYPLFVHTYYQLLALLSYEETEPFVSITPEAFNQKMRLITGLDSLFQSAKAAYLGEWQNPTSDPPSSFGMVWSCCCAQSLSTIIMMAAYQ